jgi:hypothetical protein
MTLDFQLQCEVFHKAKKQHPCVARIMVFKVQFKNTPIVVIGRERQERLNTDNHILIGQKLLWMLAATTSYSIQICIMETMGSELIWVIQTEHSGEVVIVAYGHLIRTFHTILASRFQLALSEGENQVVLENWWSRHREVTASVKYKAKLHDYISETSSACHRPPGSWIWMPIILEKCKKCKMTRRVKNTWFRKEWNQPMTDSAYLAWNGDLVKSHLQKIRRNIFTRKRRTIVSK